MRETLTWLSRGLITVDEAEAEIVNRSKDVATWPKQRPDIIMNFPMDVTAFSAIAKACPKGSVLVATANGMQAHVYFNADEAPRREDKKLRVQLEVVDRDDDA